MHERVKALMDKRENLIKQFFGKIETSREEEVEFDNFMDDWKFNMAAALIAEVDEMKTIAKLICIANGEDIIKLKVE